ncbi:MAG: hypothetical protein ACRC2R_12225 [Xenococcaceae cyanobacterium]
MSINFIWGNIIVCLSYGKQVQRNATCNTSIQYTLGFFVLPVVADRK